MIDGGAIVNVMPTLFFKKLGKDEDELKPPDTMMIDFIGGQPAKGVLTTKLMVGSKTLKTTFFVVDVASHYNLLLGRDWIHANKCNPSTLHEKLFQWVGDRVVEIATERRPQLVNVSMESVSHINWAKKDSDQISFVRITEDGVQVKLQEEASHLVVGDEPPWWIK